MTLQKKRKKLLIYIISVLFIAVLVLAWYLDRQHIFRSRHPQPDNVNSGSTASETTDIRGGSNSNIHAQTETDASKKNDNGSTDSSLDPSIIPATPTGDFVSNHSLSLSRANIVTSTCITTPGALCQIRFTMNGIVRSLPAQKTLANGSTNWDNWSLQSIGLTQGSWQITAVATNSQHSVETKDALNLVIKP